MRCLRPSLALVLILGGAALAQREDDLTQKSRLARQALLDGRYAESISLYRELVNAFPANPALRLSLAVALDKAGQASAAIPELERVTRQDSGSEPAWFLLGLAYQQLNTPAKALSPLRRALSLQPNNPDVLFELADAELTTGDAKSAVTHFSQLAAQRPDRAKGWEGLGRSYLAVSEAALLQLKRIAPDSNFYAALLRRNTPDYNEGEETKDWQGVFRHSAGATQPQDLYWLSVASTHLAQQSFTRLAELPPSPEIHAVLAEANQKTGRRMEAIEEWRKALAIQPQNKSLIARLAESLFLARDYPEAEALLSPLVASQPDNSEWQFLLGNTLLQEKRDEDALPHLEAAVRLNGKNPAFQQALGKAYLDLDQPANAVGCLEKARVADDGSISFSLSVAYRKLGRPDDARAALARYQRLKKPPEY